MPSVKDIMTKNIVTIDLSKVVFDAANLMSEQNIGCLLVMEDKKPIGIVTERDFVRRIVTQNLSHYVNVSDIMSKPLITIEPDASLSEAARLMLKNKIRRLPVVKDNKLVGIITTTDFARHLSKGTITEEILEAIARSPSVITPILIINLKVYDEVLGERSVEFAKVARKLAEKYKKVTILIAPPPPIFDRIAKITPSISQHIDPLEPDARTGYILPKEIKLLGGVGSLINHSERRIAFEDIKKNIELCRKYDLISFVCARSSEEVKLIANLNPDFIAIEPPELIGGNISVSKARPEIITQSVGNVKIISPKTMVLCGAGIKTREDVEKALQLGAKGVLIASGVVKADDVEGAMEELIKGMLKLNLASKR